MLAVRAAGVLQHAPAGGVLDSPLGRRLARGSGNDFALRASCRSNLTDCGSMNGRWRETQKSEAMSIAQPYASEGDVVKIRCRAVKDTPKAQKAEKAQKADETTDL